MSPAFFDKYKDNLTTKHCYFRCPRAPDVNGIKIFDKE